MERSGTSGHRTAGHLTKLAREDALMDKSNGGSMNGATPDASPGSISPALLRAGGFLLAYLILEWLGSIHEYKGVPITPWNPGLGVMFALLVARGAHYAPVLFAGVLLAEILVAHSSLDWIIVAAIALVVAAGYGAAATVARHYVRLGAEFVHLRDITILLAMGAAGAAVVAVGIALLLLASDRLEAGDVLVASVPLLVGDLIGIAVMTPLTLRYVLQPWPDRFATLLRHVPDMLVFAALVLPALWLIIGPDVLNGARWFYLLFLPVVAAAVRHGFGGACAGLAITQLGLVALLHIHDYDAAAFTQIQILMLVLTATGLTVGVVVSEREQANRVSQEMEALLRQKEAEAAQAARQNLVSGMASAVAHEINQPMTAARALGRSAQQLLRMPQPDLARADKNLTTMIEQIDHVGAVIRRMREFLRRGTPHLSTLAVEDLVGDMLTLVQAEAAAADIRIDVALRDDLPALHVDRVQVLQVLLNLVRNAIDALSTAAQPGRIIRISAHTIGAPPRVEFSVVDNGPGISDDLAGRLFQPLTTSKHEGLGLGLSISASIIETHGGRLWLQAATPGATEFRFTLPLDREFEER